MEYFRKEKTGKISNKTGKEITTLKAVKQKHDIHNILEFISDLLPEIVHHRNHLRHFRECLPEVLNLHDN